MLGTLFFCGGASTLRKNGTGNPKKTGLPPGSANAIVGGLYLGAAGILHIFRGIEHVNLKEATALISDLWAFLIVLTYYLYNLTPVLQTKK